MKRFLSLFRLDREPQALKKGGASPPSTRPSAGDMARMRALWAMRLDTLSIAFATGFPESAVYNAVFGGGAE